MNRKQFIILLVLVVVIGAAGLAIRERGQRSWQGAGQAIGRKLLPDLPVNDIAQLTIKGRAGEVNLARRDNVWCVRERNNYPADFSEISGLLLKFADLKVTQTEEVGPSQLGRFELLPPEAEKDSGTRVELKDQGGRTLGTLLLGKKHMSRSGDGGWPDGRYVMVGSGTKTVAVIADALDNVQPRPESWLEKEFLRIDKPRSIAAQFAETTNSWQLTRASETNDWQLADAKAGEKLDPAKASGVASPLRSATPNDVAALTASNAPSGTTLTVETFDGFTYIANIGASEGGNYPASFAISANLAAERDAAEGEKAEDKASLDKEFKDRQAKLSEKLTREQAFGGWVFQLPTYVVDPLLKHRRDLLVESGAGETAKD